jgi:NDP-sugar pyrophosphorylase family protein
MTIRAIILAAGFGTRLGALSDERPKPLLPVADVPLIRYALAHLVGHGVTEIAINLHHRGELIERELGDGSAFGCRITWSREETILGTGGGLLRLGDWLTDGGRAPFFVVNGKILTDVDLGAVARRHAERGALATMVVREVPDAAKWGAIYVNRESGAVDGILDARRPGAAPDGALRACMFTGVHVIAPALLDRLPREGESDSIRHAYIPALRDGAPIAALVHDGLFHEHSTPGRYLEGNWLVLDGRARLPFPPGPATGVDPTARVADGAVLRPPYRVGPGAVIEAGAVVGPYAVVGARAHVGPAARLDHAVVWPDASCDRPLTRAIVTPRAVLDAISS